MAVAPCDERWRRSGEIGAGSAPVGLGSSARRWRRTPGMWIISSGEVLATRSMRSYRCSLDVSSTGFRWYFEQVRDAKAQGDAM